MSPAEPPISVPACWIIVPIINVANSPCAIALRPSINIRSNIFLILSITVRLYVHTVNILIFMGKFITEGL